MADRTPSRDARFRSDGERSALALLPRLCGRGSRRRRRLWCSTAGGCGLPEEHAWPACFHLHWKLAAVVAADEAMVFK
jgi:hypothetical protein